MLSLSNDLFYATLSAYRTLVPLPQDREHPTWQNVPHRWAWVIPFYFLAYLARRKDTYTMRVLTLPSALFLVIRGTWAYIEDDPEFYYVAWLRGLMSVVVGAKCLDFALTPKGRFKEGETDLPSLHDGKVNGVYKPAGGILPPALADAHELALNTRGIGWDYGRGVHVVPEKRSLQRTRYLSTTLVSLVKNFLLFDLLLALLQQLPGIGSTDGGSMFYHSLPLFQRYFVSTCIMLVVGFFFQSGFGMMDALSSLIGVGIFQQDPKDWPPIIDNFWVAESLHEFWARKWHQTVRRTFFIIGGFLGQWVGGKVGMVLGVFTGSGLFHEVALQLVGRGYHHRATMFFVLQGVGVVLEWWYFKFTQKRVGGIVGRIWTWAFVLGLGQMLVDSWFNRGLGASRLLPHSISPAHNWYIPTIRPFLEPLLNKLR